MESVIFFTIDNKKLNNTKTLKILAKQLEEVLGYKIIFLPEGIKPLGILEDLENFKSFKEYK